MLNENFILNRIEPYLNSKRELSEFEFFELFSDLTKQEQYEVINIMIRNDIDYVDEKEEEAEQLDKVGILATTSVEKDYKHLMALTNEQLCVVFQQGEVAALSALLEKNKRFVYQLALKISREYRAPALTIDDLFMDGNLGIIEAANRFEANKGFSFLTYAWQWVRQKMVRAVMNTGYTIRIPVHAFDQIIRINNCRRRHPEATLDELIEYLSTENEITISKENLIKLIEISDLYMNTSSLNDVVGEDGDSEVQDFCADQSPSVEEIVEDNFLKEDIEKALSSLTPRERQVIEMRFALTVSEPMTLEEIGSIFGVTRERIRQIEAKALRKLRHPARSRKLKGYI